MDTKIYTGTITRRISSVKKDVYKQLLTKSDLIAALNKMKEAADSSRPSACAALCEMLGAMGVKCERGREASYYEELISSHDFPERENIEKQIMNVMYSCFDRYPSPTDYMQRIVNRLSEPEDIVPEDTLRLRILKRFVKYTDCLSYKNDSGKTVHVYGGDGYIKKYVNKKKGSAAKSYEEICGYLADDVFDVLENATKAQRKYDGTYGILRLADDLAEGAFRADGASKRDLYMFAIAFDMTYSLPNNESLSTDGQIIDYDSDIEKNLFEDYYCCNLMRFLTSAYKGNKSSLELDPSGQGINYKNFAEMVYIYFISRELDPVKKLKCAHMMTERLKASAQNSDIESSANSNHPTKYYTGLFTEDILKLPEDEFEHFVAENYNCCTKKELPVKKEEKSRNKKEKDHVITLGDMQLETEQRTAFNIYCELIEGMERNIGR